jgi:hypothetical protein
MDERHTQVEGCSSPSPMVKGTGVEVYDDAYVETAGFHEVRTTTIEVV